MLDSRIAARLLDPAALRPAVASPELPSDEAAVSLGPLLAPTLLAPDPTTFFAPPPPPPGEGNAEEGPDAVTSAGFASNPDLAAGRVAAPGPGDLAVRDSVEGLRSTAILLPPGALAREASGPQPPSWPAPRDLEALTQTAPATLPAWIPATDLPPAGREASNATAEASESQPFATAPRGSQGSGDASEARAWSQGPSLIEPSALLPAAGPRPGSPLSDQASGQGPGPGASSLGEADWPPLSSPPASAPRPGDAPAFTAWPTGRAAGFPGEPDRSAASPTGSPPAGDARADSGGESIAGLAPRLIQAVERLEAAVENMARQADRSPSPVPRPFRGRAVD